MLFDIILIIICILQNIFLFSGAEQCKTLLFYSVRGTVREPKSSHLQTWQPGSQKACFEVMQALKLTKPQDDPVYLFLLKKEQEGKPYNVAKMAAVNKFLRIYYARAMELYK